MFQPFLVLEMILGASSVQSCILGSVDSGGQVPEKYKQENKQVKKTV